MNERVAEARETFGRTRTVPFLTSTENRIAALSPGDKVIAYVLIGILFLASITSFLALEGKLLVTVPAYGGSLSEGALGSPRFINPLLAITDADRDITTLTYAGLMGLSSNGKLVPVLAETYDISPDGKMYTFTLKKNLTFSDGSPVTADDIVFTVQKAQDPALKSPEFADWSGITAEAVDTHTVRFTLAKPYAPFLENTTLGILPAHLWRNIPDEQFPFSTLTVEPVGAGPFKPTGVSRDKSGLITKYSLSAFGGYALGRPYLDAINFSFFSQKEDLINAYETGAVDSTYGIPEPGALTAPYARVFGIFFNPSNKAVLARPEVRKALSYAIDRDTIVGNVLGGYATAIMGPVPPQSAITETSVPHFADPVAEAANVLEKAGWTYDGAARLWKNTSLKLSLDSITVKTSNVPELKAVVTRVKTDWEKLGVPVDIELYEPGDLNQNVIRPRKYEALFFGMVIGRDEDLYAFWDSAERNDPGLNIALYTNKDVDAFLEEARQTSDPAKRLADLQKIEDAIAADFPAAFTHAPDFIYAVPKGLKGIALPQMVTPADRFAGVENWYMRTENIWPFLVSGR